VSKVAFSNKAYKIWWSYWNIYTNIL